MKKPTRFLTDDQIVLRLFATLMVIVFLIMMAIIFSDFMVK